MRSVLRNNRLVFFLDSVDYDGGIYYILAIISEKYSYLITEGASTPIVQSFVVIEIDKKLLSVNFHDMEGVTIMAENPEANEKVKEVADYLEEQLKKLMAKE